MNERFSAIQGEVWDQTTYPYRKIAMEDAERLVQIWAGEANACRARRAFDQARCWSEPAAVLRAAITRARVQRDTAKLRGAR